MKSHTPWSFEPVTQHATATKDGGDTVYVVKDNTGKEIGVFYSEYDAMHCVATVMHYNDLVPKEGGDGTQ